MKAVGVVAEYNPFHAGHARMLADLRTLRPEKPAVITLSGDFVQRGEAAVFSKFARAEAAVRCGASLVLEIPLPWCLSSAEGFARGGVGLLQATGVVDTLSFGSESGDLAALRECALSLKSPGFPELLRQELKTGASFASARRRAVSALVGEQTARVLDAPNDLLAVEYLRAAAGTKMDFLPILRTGSPHDGIGSASDLRRAMAAGEDWLSGIPPKAAQVFLAEMAAGRGPVLPKDLRLPILSRLREREKQDFSAVPDVSEGLENSLWSASRSETSPERIAMAAKSKRYALSRLRRSVMAAALGVRGGDAAGTPPYIRVLAMDERGAALLAQMRTSARLPVITKPAHIRKTNPEAQRIFALGSRAHDLFVLGYADEDQQRGGGDLRAAPYIHQREETAI